MYVRTLYIYIYIYTQTHTQTCKNLVINANGKHHLKDIKVRQ